MTCESYGNVTICRPTITERRRRKVYCPVCREREWATGTFAEWYGWTWEWDCGTWAADGEYRRPRELIVDENMKRPDWLRRNP